MERLFGEEAGLGGGRGGLAAGDADDTQDGELGERGARDEDAIGVGVEIGRRQVESVVEKREQVVGDDAFEGVAVAEAEPDPQAIELGAGKEILAVEAVVVVEVANEINGANGGERDFVVLAIGSEQVHGKRARERGRVEVAAEELLLKKLDDDLFVGRGWDSRFQSENTVAVLRNDCKDGGRYVMLSANFLSTHCYYWV